VITGNWRPSKFDWLSCFVCWTVRGATWHCSSYPVAWAGRPDLSRCVSTPVLDIHDMVHSHMFVFPWLLLQLLYLQFRDRPKPLFSVSAEIETALAYLHWNRNRNWNWAFNFGRNWNRHYSSQILLHISSVITKNANVIEYKQTCSSVYCFIHS